MNRITGSLLPLLAAAFAAGCGGPPEAAPARPAFRVALLTPGPISDAGWNAGAYDGLKAIEKELAASVSHVQVKSPSEFEEQFRAYAALGYALCFGHGFEFQDAAARVASAYPKTVFVTTSGSRTAPNLAPIVFELEQATYLCGLVAGRLSRTGKVGMVGGVELPSITSTFLAFEAGARAANPNADVRTVFTGSFEDVAAAKAASLALATRGATSSFTTPTPRRSASSLRRPNGRSAPSGRTATRTGLSKAVLASAVIDMPRAFVETARRVKEGRFDGGPLRYGSPRRRVVRLEPVGRLRRDGRAEGRDRGDRRKIESGALVVPRGNF